MEQKRVALVAGGSGGIGEGIVFALLASGYRTYVPTRDGDHSDRLKAYVENLGELRTVPADLSREDEVSALQAHILEQEGRIDVVVVSVGAYYYGHRMHLMPREDWDRSLEDNLATHFNLQRVFITQLRTQNSGSYVVLTGPEAESINPDEGVMSIMAAAQKMMARVVAQETSDSAVRAYTITARTTITTRSRGADANPDWIPARDVGAYITALVQGRLPSTKDVVHELRDRKHLESLLKHLR